MKIIFAYGQTCNQFWIYSNYIADALEKKQKIALWLPDISIKDYPNLLKSDFITYPLYSKRFIALLGYKNFIRITQLFLCNKFSVIFFNFFFNFFTKHDFIIADVGVKKSSYRVKYLKEIRTIFTPNLEIVTNVQNFFLDIRKDYQIVIGLHIRYGDYRQYLNGKYFYSLSQYKTLINNITKLFPDKKLIFFIASNEQINVSELKPYNYTVFPNSNASLDLYSLSKADFLIGPPSTYSAWASLLGDTPIYFIKDINKKIEIEDFIHIQQIWFE